MTCLRSLPVRNWWPLRVEGAGCRLWGVALALLFCGAMTLARPALADNWQATLYNEGLPTYTQVHVPLHYGSASGRQAGSQ